MIWWIALKLIIVHLPGDIPVEVNIEHISSIYPARVVTHGHAQKDIKCFISMDNGKIIGAVEPCAVIHDAIRQINGHNGNSGP
jgi:hypothetical protein